MAGVLTRMKRGYAEIIPAIEPGASVLSKGD